MALAARVRVPASVGQQEGFAMNYQKIRLEIADGIAVITLAQPANMNALSIPLQQELRHALAAVAAQAETGEARALILTGSGRAFCSGADLSGMASVGEGETLGQGAARMMRELTNPIIEDLQQLPVPVVAAVNGAAAGAGVSLALAADIVLAGRSAYFLLSFMPNLGIVPDLGATWMLPRLIGRARSMGLALLGDRLPAERAAAWGLIWECVDDDALMGQARALAERLAQAPAHAALEVRRAFAVADRSDLTAQLEYEAARQQVLIDKDSFREGVRAFLEKRKPNFR
mgnify:FL=1